jgi:hypothetical protein
MVGIDLAKNVWAVPSADATRRVVIRRIITCAKMSESRIQIRRCDRHDRRRHQSADAGSGKSDTDDPGRAVMEKCAATTKLLPNCSSRLFLPKPEVTKSAGALALVFCFKAEVGVGLCGEVDRDQPSTALATTSTLSIRRVVPMLAAPRTISGFGWS